MKKLLPLGFSRSAIRHQLYLNSNDVDTAACRLLDSEKEEEGEREEEREGRDDSWEEVEPEKNFSIGKYEVSTVCSSVIWPPLPPPPLPSPLHTAGD